MKVKRIIQLSEKEVNLSELEQKVKDIWREMGKLQKNIKTMEIYVKIEEDKCYYVINETTKGKFDLTL